MHIHTSWPSVGLEEVSRVYLRMLLYAQMTVRNKTKKTTARGVQAQQRAENFIQVSHLDDPLPACSPGAVAGNQVHWSKRGSNWSWIVRSWSCQQKLKLLCQNPGCYDCLLKKNSAKIQLIKKNSVKKQIKKKHSSFLQFVMLGHMCAPMKLSLQRRK